MKYRQNSAELNSVNERIKLNTKFTHAATTTIGYQFNSLGA